MRHSTLPATVLPSVFAALAALAALAPAAAGAQACGNKAAFGLYASSYMDSQLNPPPGEDVEFFSSTGGVPTIYFLLDNSGSMKRLPPNGPGFYTGTLPPLNDVQCRDKTTVGTTVGDSYDPNCAAQNAPAGVTPPPGVFGCGLDPASAPYAGPGTAIGDILQRSFAPPCGSSLTPGATFSPYSGAVNYAHESSVCKHYKNPNPVSGDDGYDPDFYCATGGTACSSKPNFFDPSMVFHEAISDGSNYPAGATNANSTWGFNGTDAGFDPTKPPGNGWTDQAVYPYLKARATLGTAADFCNQYALDIANPGAAAICNTCLTQRGFFFDGYAYRQPQEGLLVPGSPFPGTAAQVLYPSIWLTGNYLNFFPPKFIAARKVLKDLLMNNLRMRAGVAVFGSGGGTSCSSAAAEIQPLNPPCNNVYDSNANLFSNRGSFMTAINAVGFNTGTPLGEALLNVSQKFRTPSTPWFDGTCTNTAFEPPTGSALQQSFCFPCQNTSIVVITDGRPKSSDDISSAFPRGSATTAQAAATCSSSSTTGCIGNTATGVVPGPDAASCPQCQGSAAVGGPGGTSPFGPALVLPDGTTKDYLNDAIRVSWLLHNFDFRQDNETAYACNLFTDRQALAVYTLGFGAGFNADATQLLAGMASAGGGIYVSADNGAQLSAAFNQILLSINTRATSFSVASVNTLQATAGQSVIVPRFNPAKAAFWNGHLYRFELYSEFASSDCTPGAKGDLDCDCACNSVFLLDSQGAFISEDKTGVFKKNVPNLPTCGPTNKCSSCGQPSTSPADVAVPYWDAAAQLAARSWKSRAVYTAVDNPTAPDGKIDQYDPVVALIDPPSQTFVATEVQKLIPYMGLTLAAGGNCVQLASQLAAAGDSIGAAAVGGDLTSCAEAYLAYLLGADVLNQDLNSASTACRYPPTTTGTWNPLALCDRGPPNAPGKLGDVFHSSPVRVLEPHPSTSIFSAYNNQTLASLWKTPTPQGALSASSAVAYDDYAAAYKNRRRIVVVGANDGLLHAFDAGNWLANQDDPKLLPTIHTSQAPFLGYYDVGTGDELWAFLSPDLLAKVPLMIGTQHQFYVDGDPMVRDVWVDGPPYNAGVTTGTASLDGVKQPHEFHTVVIAAERRGGTHHFALDVTDATRKVNETGFRAPRFLWIWPQPTDPEELDVGESYTGFLPVPPPIAPVRIDAGPATAGAKQTYQASTGVRAVSERWVVLLPGGFDPQYLRGHGVHMLDVWTGQELLSFTRPPDTACVASADPRCNLDAPVASTVGMMAFGPTSRADLANPPNGAYFDTATFGDANGALWTIRFNDPGILDASGMATNWFGGRSFQFAKANSPGFCPGRQPFFYVSANVALYGSNRMYRVLAGTGDRYNMLDQYGGTCGPDNIRACMLRGCNVSVPQANNRLSVNDLLGTQSTGFSSSACVQTPESMTQGTPGTQCTSVQGRVEVDISNCLAFDNTAVTSTSKSFGVDCTPSGSGAACAPAAGVTQAAGSTLTQSTKLAYSNWFVSVRNFDDTGARAPFTTLAGAAAYDAARLTETDLLQIDGSNAAPPTTSADGAGWAMYFNHDMTFTDPVSAKIYNVAKADERTASPSSTPGDSCVYWNTVQPALLDASSRCPCTIQNTDRLMYFYGAQIATGGLCLQNTTISGSGASCTVSGTYTRSRGGTTLTTPPAPQPTYFVNKSGQVSVGLVSIQVGSGAQNTATGLTDDAVRQVDWLPISRSIEACRHAAGSAGPPSATACQ